MKSLIISLVFTCSFFHSQQMENVFFDKYNGLPITSINDIVNDGDHLWLSTDQGLRMFDGANFINYKIKYKGYEKAHINKLFIYNKKMYVLFEKKGCLSINLLNNEIKQVSKEPLSDIYVNKDVLIEYMVNNIIRITTSKKKVNYTICDVGVNNVTKKIFYYKNHIYLSILGKGIFVLKKGYFFKLKNIDFSERGINEHFEILGNKLFYLGLEDIWEISDNKVSKFKIKNLKYTHLNDLKLDNKGVYYLIHSDKLICSYKPISKILKKIDYKNDTNIQLKKILIGYNKIFISTNQGLLVFSINKDIVENIKNDFPKDNINVRIRRKIIENKKDILLFGNPKTVIFSNNKYKIAKGPALSVYDAILVKHKYYLATEGHGLVVCDENFNNYKEIKLPKNKGDINETYSVFYDDKDENIYIGDNKNLYYFQINDDKHIKYIPSLFVNNAIRTIKKDTINNRIYVGTDYGAFILNSKTKKIIKNISYYGNSKGRKIGDIMIDYKRNIVWIGHDKGLDIISLTDSKYLKSLDEKVMYNPIVTAILKDNYERVWISTFSGIIGYDYDKSRFIFINKNSGLINDEYSYKSAAKLSDGKVIFGGLIGYDIINPDEISFNPHYLNGKISGYELINNNNNIFKTLKNNKIEYFINDYYLKIYLSVDKEIDPLKCTFQFKIDDNNWGSLNERKYIEFINLEPIQHTLELRAFDQYGKLITFAPILLNPKEHFFRSARFKYIVGIIILCLCILSVLLFRINYLVKKKLLSEIAMDLHDEVGTSLSKVSLLIKSSKPLNSDVTEKAIQYLNETNFGLRVYINAIKYENISFDNLSDDVFDIFEKCLLLKDIKMTKIKDTDSTQSINYKVYKDVKLCSYELANNIIKHSNTTNVCVNIKMERKIIKIILLEYGTIFDNSHNNKGNGIGNITKRVERNNGTYERKLENTTLVTTITFKI